MYVSDWIIALNKIKNKTFFGPWSDLIFELRSSNYTKIITLNIAQFKNNHNIHCKYIPYFETK